MRATSLILVLALLTAGCLGAPDDPYADAAASGSGSTSPASATGSNGADASPRPAAPPVAVTFTVATRAGGVVDVAGRLWTTGNATTAILGVHGSSGSDVWGPAPDAPDYSVAHHQVAEGRAVVAIDLPGYGDTPALEPLLGMEDYALVVHQVAAHLRRGGYHVATGEAPAFNAVVGAGFSMGGLVVELTEATYHSFDAIVPAGWSHGGWSAEALACYTRGECPEDPRVIGWHLDNADAGVIDTVLNTSEAMPLMNGWSISIWGNAWTNSQPRPDEVTRAITVPVLIILGDHDWYFDKANLEDEPSHFSGSDDVELFLVEDTGHAVYHHLNHGAVTGRVDAWLDSRGL